MKGGFGRPFFVGWSGYALPWSRKPTVTRANTPRNAATIKAPSRIIRLYFLLLRLPAIFVLSRRGFSHPPRLEANRAYTHRRALNYHWRGCRYGYCVRWRRSIRRAGIGIFDI